MAHGRKIAVIGLGYVGLAVAVSFARSGVPVIGFDIDPSRIAELRLGKDRTREMEPADLHGLNLALTSDEAALRAADFYIIAVATPLDAACHPDLTALRHASDTVGRVLGRGDVVVIESTVYPGATEDECIPLLERASGLRAGRDFTLGYSPERINPGDREHRFETIAKVVACADPAGLELIAAVYATVIKAGIHRAPSIRVAEIARLVENTQRDVNIALMNEVSAICHQLDVDTTDVLAAAATKWNFVPFTPGLVGGHCVSVNPYYLAHCAEKAGYRPELVLTARSLNDGVGQRIGRECLRHFRKRNKSPDRVTVLGLTYKENVPDIRYSQVADLVAELQSSGIDVQVHDPLASAEDTKRLYGITLMQAESLLPADAVILAVPHASFIRGGWTFIAGLLKERAGLVMDVKAKLDARAAPDGIDLWRL